MGDSSAIVRGGGIANAWHTVFEGSRGGVGNLGAIARGGAS